MNFGYSKSALSCTLSQNVHSNHNFFFFYVLDTLFMHLSMLSWERGKGGDFDCFCCPGDASFNTKWLPLGHKIKQMYGIFGKL